MRDGEQIIPTTLKGRKLYNIFFKYDIEIYDITPINDNISEEQIKEWLANYDEIEDFIIIDDDPTIFSSLSNKLIQTSKNKQEYLITFIKDSFGLCERHIPDIIDRLGTKKTRKL